MKIEYKATSHRDAEPFFSVIIPTFNSAKTVLRAVESVTRQSVPHEIWVIDGKSTDGTIQLLESAGVPALRYISEADSGIYDAINKGVSLSCGQLIGVLGSDDVYAPHAFSDLRKLFERSHCDVVAGATRFLSADGATSMRADEAYGPGALLSGIPFGHNAMFATPKAYQDVGPYDLRYRICADAHWVHRAIRKKKTCSTTPTVIVDFGMEGTSSTNAKEIMDESYDVICENFPGMKPREAEALLFAVRGWGPLDPVSRIVQRLNDPLLRDAVACAFPHLIPDQPRQPVRIGAKMISVLWNRFRR
jgi:glycosyltransferase involved in cell wall biosynthesis